MKKRFFRAGAMIALAAGMLVVFGISCQRNRNQAPDVSSEVSANSSAVSTTPKETVPEGPVLEALPAQFLNDYAENEVAADARYKGKLVKITGVIANIGRTSGGDPYIELEASKDMDLADAVLAFSGVVPYTEQQQADISRKLRVTLLKSEESNMSYLKAGARVTIIGAGNGKSIKNAKFEIDPAVITAESLRNTKWAGMLYIDGQLAQVGAEFVRMVYYFGETDFRGVAELVMNLEGGATSTRTGDPTTGTYEVKNNEIFVNGETEGKYIVEGIHGIIRVKRDNILLDLKRE